MQNSEQIEAVAAAWLAKRDRGGWQEADEAELNAWLEASTAHQVAFVRLEAAWNEANRLQVLGAGSSVRDEQSHPRRSARPVWYGLAASFFLAAAIGVGWTLWPAESASYRTAVGGLEAVPLADGSRITLNTDTEIRVAVSEAERRVELEHGEAFFDVAADLKRPFVVKAGDERVVAVGTQFSVMRNSEGVRVAVTEGRVRMERGGGQAAPAPTELDAGTVARSGESGVLVQQKAQDELEQALSWRRGFLTFRDTPLSEAVREFNRYNRRKLRIEDPDVGSMRIGGQFRSTNVAAFMRLLEEGFAIDVEEQRDGFVLRGVGGRPSVIDGTPSAADAGS
jgi:transmembrane sensor